MLSPILEEIDQGKYNCNPLHYSNNSNIDTLPIRYQVGVRIGGTIVTAHFPYIPVLTPVLEEGWLISNELWPDYEEPMVGLLPDVEFLRDFINVWCTLYS